MPDPAVQVDNALALAKRHGISADTMLKKVMVVTRDVRELFWSIGILDTAWSDGIGNIAYERWRNLCPSTTDRTENTDADGSSSRGSGNQGA